MLSAVRYRAGGVTYEASSLVYRSGGVTYTARQVSVGRNDSAALEASRRRYHRRKANTVGDRYVLSDVAKRDNWCCHICGKRVDMRLSGRHPHGPTADHLIPVSCGGGDEPHNVALAHRRCNIKRSTGGVAQLRLVG